MRYAGLIKNDIAAGEGINVTLFVQGCPIHCPGCHNPQTWSFIGGKEFTIETLDTLFQSLEANGIHRNFSIAGGEPLCNENLFFTHFIISKVREVLPDIKIYLWSGYTYEELQQRTEKKVHEILNLVDVLIDGPFILAERDITLDKRGSRNQRIINLGELRRNGKK